MDFKYKIGTIMHGKQDHCYPDEYTSEAFGKIDSFTKIEGRNYYYICWEIFNESNLFELTDSERSTYILNNQIDFWWVNADERVPADDVIVWVLSKWFIHKWRLLDWLWIGDDGNEFVKVTHWIYLPNNI